MTIFMICVAVAFLILTGYVGWLKKQLDKLEDRITKTHLKLFELEDTIKRVDESTGEDIHRLGTEFQEFRNTYGEAAVEEKRQAAKAEKAWAEGVQNIMNYGTQLYGRGGTK